MPAKGLLRGSAVQQPKSESSTRVAQLVAALSKLPQTGFVSSIQTLGFRFSLHPIPVMQVKSITCQKLSAGGPNASSDTVDETHSRVSAQWAALLSNGPVS